MKTTLAVLGLAGLALPATAQVGIGTTAPHAKAALEITASDKGLLIPRLSQSQRTALTSVPQGLLVYQTDGQEGFWYYAGSPGAWVFLNPSGAGLALPYSGSVSTLGNAFQVSNTGLGAALVGQATNGAAVSGTNTNTGAGVYGNNTGTGNGLVGQALTGAGLLASSASGPALSATKSGSQTGRLLSLSNTNAANDSTGLFVSTVGVRPAIKGADVSGSGAGVGLLGITQSGYGVRGVASATNGYGVQGESASSYGVRATSGSGVALYARSTSGVALQAQKGVPDLGRVAELTNTNPNNDSTALYLSSVGDRPTLRAVNSANSAQAAIRGVKQSTAADGIGVEGVITSGATGNAAGVLGHDKSGSSTGSGVIGLTAGGYGVRGIASGSGGFGVSGQATDSYGVIGSSQGGAGVYGSSSSGYGVQASSGSTAAVYGSASPNVATNGAVVGANTSTGTNAVGVLGLTQNGFGVRGVASDSDGYGVEGAATDGYGVRGLSTGSSGVYGQTTAGNSAGAGVEGRSTNSSGIGVRGTTISGYGVRGEATGSSGYGVTGVASATNGIGVLASATGAATGLIAQTSGTGRAASFSQTNAGSSAAAVEISQSGAGPALSVGGTTPLVTLQASSSTLRTTLNEQELRLGATNSAGGSHTQINIEGTEIQGGGLPTLLPDGSAGPSTVLIARQTGTGIALLATSGVATGRYAATFRGDIIATGSINGALKNFRIDHPLDPANRYLVHTSVESNELLNVYSGNAQLDAHGEATVQLPAWFDALNTDVRYQLTPIGAAFTPYVLEKLHDGRFRIGGAAGAEVSWLLTAVRHDAFARQHPPVVEPSKEPENRGRYLHPEAFGQPAALGIGEAAATRPARPVP